MTLFVKLYITVTSRDDPGNDAWVYTCKPQEGVIVLGSSKATDQPGATPEWFMMAAKAVSRVVDQTPEGALVVHRLDLPRVLSSEGCRTVRLSDLQMMGLPIALKERAGLRTANYREGCSTVLVIYKHSVTAHDARKARAPKAYASRVRDALA